jgi:hypothetical protein
MCAHVRHPFRRYRRRAGCFQPKTATVSWPKTAADAAHIVEVGYHIEVIDGGGWGRLERLVLRDTRSGDQETVPAFVLHGPPDACACLRPTLAAAMFRKSRHGSGWSSRRTRGRINECSTGVTGARSPLRRPVRRLTRPRQRQRARPSFVAGSHAQQVQKLCATPAPVSSALVLPLVLTNVAPHQKSVGIITA